MEPEEHVNQTEEEEEDEGLSLAGKACQWEQWCFTSWVFSEPNEDGGGSGC